MTGAAGPRAAAMVLALGLLAHAGAAEEGGPSDPGADGYAAFCATCHGALAMGEGPTASVLTVPVPDLTRLAAQNGGAFPMARVLAQIVGRDPVLAHGTPMPIYGAAFAAGGTVTVETADGPVPAPRAAAEIARWLAARQRGAAGAE